MSKDLHIGDKYRTNPLSHTPGGHTVTVIWEDGTRYIYDKVKNPLRYVQAMADKGSSHGVIFSVYVDGSPVWQRNSEEKSRIKAWNDFLAK